MSGAARPSPEPSDQANPNAGSMGYEVPFSIRFTGSLTGQRLALLVSELGLHTTVRPKQQVSMPMATAQLDPSTGLYLLRGQTDDEWVLECRAYGNPAPAWLRQWYLRAIWVVGQLDSGLEVRSAWVG